MEPLEGRFNQLGVTAVEYAEIAVGFAIAYGAISPDLPRYLVVQMEPTSCHRQTTAGGFDFSRSPDRQYGNQGK